MVNNRLSRIPQIRLIQRYRFEQGAQVDRIDLEADHLCLAEFCL
jgi:hypothetical protein